MVSPGAIAFASTLRRFVDAPVAPRAIVTVPELTVWLADVELVKVANVPSPAMLAVAPSTAAVASSLWVRGRRRRRPACRRLGRGARQVIPLIRKSVVVHRQG